jgi:galactokinase
VNLIGEHTDYNEGLVMPAAIELSTWVAINKRDDHTLHIHSENYSEAVQLALDNLNGPPRSHWSDYVRGIAALIQSTFGKLEGANLLIDSDVPIGAGLSSSAAIEVAVALALSTLSGVNMPGLQMAKLAQRAEHEYTGTLCGLMDQFIAVFGRADHALLLDCRSLESRPLPLPKNIDLVICNSGVKHELASGEYNCRRADCETGVKLLQPCIAGLTSLRDVTPESLNQYKDRLPEIVYHRCRHVVSENQRVLAAANALEFNDSTEFGKLMYASHASLRDDYEVSCKELDLLVEMASELDGVYGARMMGGGFGGSTINLVAADSAVDFQKAISEIYRKKTGITPAIYLCTASAGAAEVDRY